MGKAIITQETSYMYMYKLKENIINILLLKCVQSLQNEFSTCTCTCTVQYCYFSFFWRCSPVPVPLCMAVHGAAPCTVWGQRWTRTGLLKIKCVIFGELCTWVPEYLKIRHKVALERFDVKSNLLWKEWL